jgi:hypothetical protein
MEAHTNTTQRRPFARRVLLFGFAVAAAVTAAPAAAWAQYGGITPNAPYDQSRRVARRTARRTANRNAAAQEQYVAPPPQQQAPQPQPVQPQQPVQPPPQ